ncbi:MAG: hypothetical protein J6T50_01345 [Lachnospiraceae bacterium]|nr:hypothetical protein [Lachnospiraceae bacterium]
MKKRIAMLMGVLALSVFTACGSSADIDIDDVEFDEDYDIDWEDDSDDPGYAEASLDEVDELVGVWRGENVFVLEFTFYPDGTYHYSSDGGMSDDGTYEFDGSELDLTGSEDNYHWHFEYSRGLLTDDDGTEFMKILELSQLEDAESSDDYDDDDDYDLQSDIIGYWQGNNTPPNDWFIFTSNWDFYCNRDNGYIEWGTYTFDGAYVDLTFVPSGETDSFLLFDTDYLLYDPCDGLFRTTTDDYVDQWILDEVGN